jgi:hypothetical protein
MVRKAQDKQDAETKVSSRAAAGLAWLLVTTTVAAVGCAVVLAFSNQADFRNLTYLVGVLSSVIVGALIVFRRPRNPVGWLLLGGVTTLAIQEFTLQYVIYGLVTEPGSLPLARAMVWLLSWIYVPAIALILVFLPLYFPNGRLLSQRWRWLMWSSLLFTGTVTVYSAFRPGAVKEDLDLVNPVGLSTLRPALDVLDPAMVVAYFAVLFSSAATLVVRFRRSTGDERQQIKWLAFAASVVPVWFLVSPATRGLLYGVLDGLVFACIPSAVGIAILRYRLYDIDVVINRTLVYGSLTVTLVALYFGGIVVSQRVFVVLTGEQSTLAVVASTLVIAALFNPLRRRIQSLIDRRFYRRKYDAAKILERFSTRLRDETDLEALNNELVRVVRETMQPAHVSLWLGPDAGWRESEGNEP